MSNGVSTYNPKDLVITLGTHVATGIADDSFVTIDPNGDGITKKVGCDGEVVRSISPDDTSIVKVVVFQTSPTNSFLNQKLKLDKKTGEGMFPILIKDLRGGLVHSAQQAWVTKPPSRGYGKEAGTREWEIHTGIADTEE